MRKPDGERATVRKTFQEQLRPTPAHERALDEVLWRCRALDNTALQQHLTGWRRGQGQKAPRLQPGEEGPFRRADAVEEEATISLDYAQEGHTVHLVAYHLILCPKRRGKVLAAGPVR